MQRFLRLLLLCTFILKSASAIQKFLEPPTYREVNPGGDAVLPCVVADIKGECRWEKDGEPVGLYEGKYEWVGRPEEGECSLRVRAASMEYDNGVWQCQVTASDFKQRDTLVSDGAELVVRAAPKSVTVKEFQDPAGGGWVSPQLPTAPTLANAITGAAGTELELECTAEGGNPAPRLTWFVGGTEAASTLAQADTRLADNTWTSRSRLRLPVSRADHAAQIRCEAEHDALNDAPLVGRATLNILYPPRVTASRSAADAASDNNNNAGALREGGTVTLFCDVDSNPAPSRISWRRSGAATILTSQQNFTISPVSRETAGSYECAAENMLGLSQPAVIELQVEYAPSVVKTTPSGPELTATAGSQLQLTCHSPAFPPPTYQWLQRLPHDDDAVLVRGEGPDLVLDAATYDDQGEWVCRAANAVGQAESQPVRVTVRGAPQISRLTVHSEVVVKTGDDANLEVEFCANPLPRQAWHLGPLGGVGSGQLLEEANLVLQSNERHGRFVVDNLLPLVGMSGAVAADSSLVAGRRQQQDCYLAVLRILGAHPADSRAYLLQLENEHGLDSHEIRLTVIDTAVSQEIFIAIIVGSILTILIVTLIIVYMVKADKCCSSSSRGGDAGPLKNGINSHVDGSKAGGGQPDVGSDRTDVESCHSGSTLSGQTVLPPDALYGTVDKLKKKKKKLSPGAAGPGAVDVVDNLFNDSREQLRPDILASLSRSGSPATGGSNSYPAATLGPHTAVGGGHEANVVVTYNELCFPKASNCGSMKRKRDRNQQQNQYGQYPTSQYPYGQNPYSHNPYSHSQPTMGDAGSAFGYANYLNEDFTGGHHAVTNRIYQ